MSMNFRFFLVLALTCLCRIERLRSPELSKKHICVLMEEHLIERINTTNLLI